MATFTYLSVMTSMLLGLGLTQLFAGIGNLVQVRQRVKPDWLHSLWIAIVILAHVHMWWSFWGLRDAVDWTYVSFVYLLVGPALLVFASHIIMPGEFYEEVHQGKFDLKRHYENSSRLFFGAFAAIMAWAIFLEPVLGVRPLLVGFRRLQVLAFVAIGSCALTRSRGLHRIAAFVVLALWGIVFLIRFRAGEFDFHR